ncbi:hypothetical protein LJC00_01265 [Dysgonomonas sp. OttesenSCG-928-M03]|nr:hypothetical protein [Dysgonomonas sp. OttesenSCG-928-M03]
MTIPALVLMMLELLLFTGMLSVAGDSDTFKVLIFFLIIVLFGAWMFALVTLLRRNDRNALLYFLSVMAASFTSGFLILVNLVTIVLAANERKLRYILIPVFSLILMVFLISGALPGQFIGLIVLLNFTSTLSWIVIAKNSFLLNWGSSLFGSAASANPATNQVNTSSQSPVSNQNRQRVDNRQVNNRNVAPNAPSTEVYDKGWVIDDTEQLSVNLLTIEDVIYPVMLKNEHEKGVKDLIVYIRKLKKYSDTDIANSLGEEGLSSYLNKFFMKLKIDAVRSVYIRSLYLLIEDYSSRDSRVKMYLEKLSVKQPG